MDINQFFRKTPDCEKVLKGLDFNQHNIDLHLQRCLKLAEKKQQHKNKQKMLKKGNPNKQYFLSFTQNWSYQKYLPKYGSSSGFFFWRSNQTPPHENGIAKDDASSLISKLLKDFIEKFCEPEVDKPDTHDRDDMINKDVKKIDGSSRLIFWSS